MNLYFGRDPNAPNAGLPDIYYAAINRRGKTLVDAVPVVELNAPNAVDAAPSLRRDGLEIFFWSNREGNPDLFTSTRESILDPWSMPIRLDAPLSTAANDSQPKISWDARTLLFNSTREPTLGGIDIWTSTRTKIGRE